MFPAKFQFKNNLSESGQSLIEIIATLAIGVVLILALVALSVRSNSSSDFSKAQNQASRLASEGLEIINSIRATSDTGTILLQNSSCSAAGGINTNWFGLFDPTTGNNNIVDCPAPGRPGQLYPPSDGACNSSIDSWCLHLSGNGMETITLEGRNFNRTIFVADTPPASLCNTAGDFGFIKQFTVVVSWNDSSGSHNSTTTSCIRK